jgi:mono/diheme cytochrome c family protein
MRFGVIASVARRMHGTALLLLVMLSMTICGGAPWPHRPSSEARADETLTDPYLGQPDAIAAGDQIYHSHCIICHGLRGGRGPNLFATQLSDEQFLEVVINGRKGTQMPAWGFQLSPDDVWKVRAFLKAHPNGLSL